MGDIKAYVKSEVEKRIEDQLFVEDEGLEIKIIEALMDGAKEM